MESLLSHAENPAGWVDRTAEEDEMAMHGWRVGIWCVSFEYILFIFLVDLSEVIWATDHVFLLADSTLLHGNKRVYIQLAFLLMSR
jgi:hypothetical protein